MPDYSQDWCQSSKAIQKEQTCDSSTLLMMEYTFGCCMTYLIARLDSSGVGQDGNVSIKLPGSLWLGSLVD